MPTIHPRYARLHEESHSSPAETAPAANASRPLSPLSHTAELSSTAYASSDRVSEAGSEPGPSSSASVQQARRRWEISSVDSAAGDVLRRVEERRRLAVRAQANDKPIAANHHGIVADAMAKFAAPQEVRKLRAGIANRAVALVLESHAMAFAREYADALAVSAGKHTTLGDAFVDAKKTEIAKDIRRNHRQGVAACIPFVQVCAIPALGERLTQTADAIAEDREVGIPRARS